LKTFVNVDGIWIDTTYDLQKMEAVKIPFLIELEPPNFPTWRGNP
jgi:hypothetical protein